MTLRRYAERKQLQLLEYSVDVSHDRIHADDCIGCLSGGDGRIDRFTLRVIFDTKVDAAKAGSPCSTISSGTRRLG